MLYRCWRPFTFEIQACRCAADMSGNILSFGGIIIVFESRFLFFGSRQFLSFHQLSVCRVRIRQELVVGTLLENFSASNDNDIVGVLRAISSAPELVESTHLDSRQTMGNDDGCSPNTGTLQSFLHDTFRLSVQSRGSFIE